MKKHVQAHIVRLVAMVWLAGLGLLASASVAEAQYVVQWYSPPEKTSGYTCYHYKTVAPSTPDDTGCWAVVVWYKGTWFGFNNYAIAGSAAWTMEYACPSSVTFHQSLVQNQGIGSSSKLAWGASISGPGGYVSNIYGHVTYQGGVSRNITLNGIDPSKC
jgi:hypothetical protein